MSADLVNVRPLFDLAKAVRSKDRFVPKGVYRFKTFEEADEWMLKMTTRR